MGGWVAALAFACVGALVAASTAQGGMPPRPETGDGCAVLYVAGQGVNQPDAFRCSFDIDVVSGHGPDVWMRPLHDPPTIANWNLTIQAVDPLRPPARWPTDNGGILNTNEVQKTNVNGQFGAWRFNATFTPQHTIYESGLWGAYACQGTDPGCLKDAVFAVCLVVADVAAQAGQPVRCQDFLFTKHPPK